MSLSRVVNFSLGCHACRNAIVRSFTSNSTINGSQLSRTPWIAPRPLSRSFTSTGLRKERKNDLPPPEVEPGFDFLEPDNPPSAPRTESTLEATAPIEAAPAETIPVGEDTSAKGLLPESIVDASPDTTSAPEASQSPPLPWYLQAQRDRERTTPSAEHTARELIPDLPSNPPPLLKTLLEYISITAGLDDLQILDLRHLDPPPALGTKLIMIIGTARSEKHLHVSADRFCRHLRREHGLRANAAGLLGRNELKIKLRRKAKRMKMLANIGGQEPEGNLDDGIRTGWICCTVGKIEAHPEDTDIPGLTADDDNFVGFRDVKPGVNVVVQMFTEEKRAEVDLETLWNGVLKTHERKDEQAEEKLRVANAYVEDEDVQGKEEEWAEAKESVAPAPQRQRAVTARLPSDPFPENASRVRRWDRPSSTKGDFFPPSSGPNRTRQLRRLHTVGM